MSKIPLPKTELLQDLVIELGRRFAADHPFRSFTVEVDSCEHDGDTLERLSVWAYTSYGTRTNLTVWEDGKVWISVTLLPAANNEKYTVGFYPDCAGCSPGRMAEAFRDTVSLSTRLCYGESPLPTLREVWRYTDEVEITGWLNPPRKAHSHE
jgi:hypothetical protein